MLTSRIVPAIIPQSYADLVSQISALRNLPEVHVDVIDGEFAPGRSWPYPDGMNTTTVLDLLAPFSLEVDLMVERPLVAADAWLEAGADQLVFHIETISAEALKHFSDSHAVTVGVSLSNDTPLSELDSYIPYVDYVQLMGIAKIGTQGQPFDESVIERILILSQTYPNLTISIDGSVNQATLPRLATLPLGRFIVGSAIMGADNPREAYQALTKLSQS